MEFIFEALFQFLGELLLQIVVQLFVEWGFRSLADIFQRRTDPVLAVISLALWGFLAGGISLLLLPAFIHDPTLRIVNLIVTPVALGLVMMLVGKFRLKLGQNLIRLDQFGYAFVFAFAMALVRFIWAN